MLPKTVRSLCCFLAAALLTVVLQPFGSKAVTASCNVYDGTNVGCQNYTKWTSPATSFLEQTGSNELMRFQVDAVSGRYLVEYYDTSFNLKRSLTVPQELDIFGSYYYDGTYHFVLSGQENLDEEDDQEVFRLTKYDKNWTKLGTASLKGGNTTIPFEGGTARMDSDGKMLFVRTCHEMYTSYDGLNHQANVTIQFDTQSMTVVDAEYDVYNIAYGYVSHSFNQFIKLDEGKIVGVDHGDAHLRAVVLCKYNTAYTSDGFERRCSYREMPHIPSTAGNTNKTGVSVGGFELSDSSYLVAGNSVDLNVNYNPDSTRNIFVSSSSRTSTDTPVIHQITSYPNGSTSPSTPPSG